VKKLFLFPLFFGTLQAETFLVYGGKTGWIGQKNSFVAQRAEIYASRLSKDKGKFI